MVTKGEGKKQINVCFGQEDRMLQSENLEEK